MLKEQEHLLELLREFDGLCSKVNAPYSLIEHSLAYARRVHSIRGCEIDIAMNLAGYQSMRAAFDKNPIPEREFEGLDNNPEMPGWYFRYVDKSTTMYMLDYARCRRAHGVGINIHIIRSFDKYGRELRDYECAMHARIVPDWQFNQSFPTGLETYKKLFEWRQKQDGAESFRSWLLDSFKEVSFGEQDSAGLIVTPIGNSLEVPKDFLEDTDSVTIAGLRFKCSKHSVPYLRERYGEKWASEDLYYRRQSYMSFYSDVIPYAAYLDKIEDIVDDDDFWAHRSRWLEKYFGKVKSKTEDQRARWNNFYMVRDRYSDWKRYMPHKEQIIDLYKNGSHSILWLMLDTYREHVREYSKAGIAFTFDEDIWDIHLKLCRENGFAAFADKLSELYEENHLPNITGAAAEAYLEKASNKKLHSKKPVFSADNLCGE